LKKSRICELRDLSVRLRSFRSAALAATKAIRSTKSHELTRNDTNDKNFVLVREWFVWFRGSVFSHKNTKLAICYTDSKRRGLRLVIASVFLNLRNLRNLWMIFGSFSSASLPTCNFFSTAGRIPTSVEQSKPQCHSH
jgi:hypothetical protein